MIKSLATDELSKLRELVSRDGYGAFFSGNLHNYNLNSAVTGNWCMYGEHGGISAVLQRYDGFFLVDALEGFDCTAFAGIISACGKYQSLSGKPHCARQFIGKIAGQSGIRNWMKYYGSSKNRCEHYAHPVFRTTPADCRRVNDLLVAIEEFGFFEGEICERYNRTVANGEARYFAIEDNGKLCACAATAAECPQSAVIVSVCCLPEYRRQGMARECVQALCDTLSAEGKELFLFYENPAAGRMYRELGFAEVGNWMIIEK